MIEKLYQIRDLVLSSGPVLEVSTVSNARARNGQIVRKRFDLCPECVVLKSELPLEEGSGPVIVQPVIVRGVSAAPEGQTVCCNECGEQVLWAYLVGLMGMQSICAECMTRWFEAVNA